MRNDLISYNGAYLYQVDDGTWEGNLLGFHYSADTLDELKAKIDKYKGNAESSFAYATSKQYAAPIYGDCLKILKTICLFGLLSIICQNLKS